MILLTCAVGRELSFLEPVPHIELLVTGVGPIEAGISVARALAQSPYSLVVNAGVAGAFEGCAAIGDGVVVSEEFMQIGREDGKPLELPDGARVIDRTASDLVLVDRLVELGYASKRGITVSSVTATQQSAQRLAAYRADIESMEGFAVLRAAEMAAVPAVELRGISNIVTARERSGWDFDKGCAGLQKVLAALLALVPSLDE
jgi:futalosine hydrolase